MAEVGEFIDRSNSNAEKYTLRQKLFGSDEVTPMWVADMDLATPSCVLDAVKRRLEHPVMGYEIMKRSGFEAQCGWVKSHHALEISPEWLSYSPSVVASIGCAIRAFSEEGDEVIVQSPVYPPFYDMVRINKRVLVLNPLHRGSDGVYRFDLDDLRSKITPKTRLLLLCSPHNPVGRVWSPQELTALGEVCLEHGIRIVSDEIHCDIVYPPHKHTPLPSLSPELFASTVMLIGPGKTFNMAGFSISSVCIGDEKMRNLFDHERKKVHFGDGAALSHVAFEAAYRDGGAWHRELILHLEANRAKIAAWSASTPAISHSSPEGSYLAWLDCRSLGLGDRQLREFFVREAGLGLSAGLSFGKEGSGFMRLNFAVTSAILEEALEKIENALQRNGYV